MILRNNWRFASLQKLTRRLFGGELASSQTKVGEKNQHDGSRALILIIFQLSRISFDARFPGPCAHRPAHAQEYLSTLLLLSHVSLIELPIIVHLMRAHDLEQTTHEARPCVYRKSLPNFLTATLSRPSLWVGFLHSTASHRYAAFLQHLRAAFSCAVFSGSPLFFLSLLG